MEKKALKLAIIKKVTTCDDEQFLQTVWSLLEQLGDSASPLGSEGTSWLTAFFGETENTPSSPATNEQDLDDLQQSIDDVFGTTS